MTFTRPVVEATYNSTDATVLLDQFIQHLLKEASPVTARNWRDQLNAIIREMEIGDITKVTLLDIDLYLVEKAKTRKASTISIKQQVLRSFFQYCQEYREINLAFHWDAIRRRKVRSGKMRSFTEEEVKTVLESCTHRQDSLMIRVLFYTGIRISELLNLKVEDIRFTQIQIRGKGSYDRVVHMPPSLAQDIRYYCQLRLINSGHVFRPLQKHSNHPSAYYISADSVRKRLERIFMKSVGVQMHPHQLRHSFAMHWLRNGGDIRTLQILLGHDNIETTMIYLQLTDDHTGDIYSKVFST